MKIDYKLSQEPQHVIDDIDTLLKECWTATGHNDAGELEMLSRASIQLPTLLNGLGYYLAVAENEMDLAKDMKEYELSTRVENLLKSSDIAVNKATIEVENSDEYREVVKDYYESKKTYRLLKLKYDSVSKSFDGLRSRLSVIKNDIQRET